MNVHTVFCHVCNNSRVGTVMKKSQGKNKNFSMSGKIQEIIKILPQSQEFYFRLATWFGFRVSLLAKVILYL